MPTTMTPSAAPAAEDAFPPAPRTTFARLAQAMPFGRSALGVAGVILFLVLIQVLSLTSGLSAQSFPRATEIVATTLGLFGNGEFLFAVGQTLYAALVGLVVATVIAVPLGVLLGTFRVTYDASSALIEFIRPVPSVAMIPLALLLFGATAEMKIALIIFSVFWIVLFNTIYGVRDVDPLLKDNARIFGYGSLAVLARISLPSAAPFIYTGIRIATTAAFLVAVGAEMLAGGSGGLGEWLRRYQESGQGSVYVWAGAFFSGLVGLGINFLLNFGERRLFPWNVSTRSM